MTVTATPYAVENITALKALTGLPTSGSGLYYARFVDGIGWYNFDPDSTVGGIAPNVGTGRWFPISGTFDSGTTAERQLNPTTIVERYNTSLACYEHFANGTWIQRRYGTSSKPIGVLNTILSGTTVHGAVYVPSLGEIFGMNGSGTNTFYVFSVEAFSLVTTFNVAAGLLSLVYCSSNGYIYAYGSTTVQVINPATRSVVTTITLTGSASGVFQNFIYYCESNNRLYAARTTGISIIDPTTNSEIAFISPLDPVSSTAMFFATEPPIEVGDHIYIGGTQNSIVKISKTDNSFVVIPVTGGSSNRGHLVYCPTTNKIYVCCLSDRLVHIFNVSSALFGTTISLLSGTNTGYSGLSATYCPATNKILIMGAHLHSIDVVTETIDVTIRVSTSTATTGIAYFSSLHNLILFSASRTLSYQVDPYTLSFSTLTAGHFFLEIPELKKLFAANTNNNNIGLIG